MFWNVSLDVEKICIGLTIWFRISQERNAISGLPIIIIRFNISGFCKVSFRLLPSLLPLPFPKRKSVLVSKIRISIAVKMIQGVLSDTKKNKRIANWKAKLVSFFSVVKIMKIRALKKIPIKPSTRIANAGKSQKYSIRMAKKITMGK
ncbi:MAG: hypothetical protein AB9907_15710 [Flexilinea sp.]